MKSRTLSRSAFLAGVSALTLSVATPTVHAQDNDDEDQRTLGTVLVTTQKTEESIQDVPIAVSAFSEEALDNLQLAAGPDLVKSIPNVAVTRSNFNGFNFKIRGIGRDLIANSGDDGVGIHQNDVPLTASRLFEAEFFDVERVETLRGPQGTLYGRNATGGVVNVITAKPVLEEFQADAKLTYGNHNTFKAKGMINLPLGETAALRLAGSYLARDGYATNSVTGNDFDDRNLYGLRATFAWEPTDRVRTWLSYDYFEEDDSRARIGKQLCTKDPLETSFGGISIDPADQVYTSLGCQEAPLSSSFDRTNSVSTLWGGLALAGGLVNGDVYTGEISRDLREIGSAFDPIFRSEQELITAKAEFDVTDSLLLTILASQGETSYLTIEDYLKTGLSDPFNDLSAIPPGLDPAADLYNALFPGGVVNDPQLGAANTLLTFDLSGGATEQDSLEVRIQSDFDGPFNFNLGGIYLDYEAADITNNEHGYFVLSNAITGIVQLNNAAGGAILGGPVPIDTAGTPPSLFNQSFSGEGGNYYRSISPYRLESLAFFGEGYFDATDNLTFTVGLRYTDDKKEQDTVPTILLTPNGIFGPTGLASAEFEEVTGRVGFDWQPDLAFSEDTLIYGFYSRGYKGGGINPPQPAGANLFPELFDPEFINSFELGTKNTLAEGALQLNVTGFHYDYEGYQITQIVNRTSANFNIDAKIEGLEVESIWNPASTLLINANIGFLDTEIQDSFAIDVLDRANGRSDLVVLKNAANFSNCVVSAQGYATVLGAIAAGALAPGSTAGLCVGAFAGQETALGVGNVTYVDSNGVTQTVGGLTPFDGEAKSLDGNSIPNAPETTINLGAEYTWEGVFGGAWELTARGDYYNQADSFSRVWNTGRDELESWDNVNVMLRLNNVDRGFAVELFGKNITDEEVITGAYLTDDTSGLFTNIFLTEPATYGVSISKSW